MPLARRVAAVWACGPLAGPLFACLVLLGRLWLAVLGWWVPAGAMDVCPPPRRGNPINGPPRTQAEGPGTTNA